MKTKVLKQKNFLNGNQISFPAQTQSTTHLLDSQRYTSNQSLQV